MADPDDDQRTPEPTEDHPHWTEQWEAAHSPEAQHRARFINRLKRDLEAFSTFQTKIVHINTVTADIYDELWALLTLKALREVRENSEQATRRIIVEMIRKDIITPQAAAKASGYSRTSVYNWLKDTPQQNNAEPAAQDEASG